MPDDYNIKKYFELRIKMIKRNAFFFKQGLAAVCTTEDYTGHEKALTKKDTFEGGNFSKTILI